MRGDQHMATLHRDLPAVPMWGYDGQSPGPLIEVRRGEALTVHWQNALPATHLFSDGWPDVYYGTGGANDAVYPNDQPARMLWYHDHAMPRLADDL